MVIKGKLHICCLDVLTVGGKTSYNSSKPKNKSLLTLLNRFCVISIYPARLLKPLLSMFCSVASNVLYTFYSDTLF